MEKATIKSSFQSVKPNRPPHIQKGTVPAYHQTCLPFAHGSRRKLVLVLSSHQAEAAKPQQGLAILQAKCSLSLRRLYTRLTTQLAWSGRGKGGEGMGNWNP